MLTRSRLTDIDAVANIACGCVNMFSPQPWRWLELPQSARPQAALGMMLGGAMMLAAPSCGVSERWRALSSAVANIAWAGIGLSAVPGIGDRRAKVFVVLVAAYDGAMGVAKTVVPDGTFEGSRTSRGGRLGASVQAR